LQLVEKAKNNDEVLSYVWEMDYNESKKELKLRVWLKFVSKNSDLWSLKGSANLAIVETNILCSPIPHVIKSRWAGLAVTAGAVRVWIAKMLSNNIISK
jgi:homoserine dehydrogenase